MKDILEPVALRRLLFQKVSSGLMAVSFYSPCSFTKLQLVEEKKVEKAVMFFIPNN